jgi:hypothetical protein
LTYWSDALGQFDHVFCVVDDLPAPQRIGDEEAEEVLGRSSSVPDVQVQGTDDRRRSRNSIYYSQSGADALMENRGSLPSPAEDEEASSEDESESTGGDSDLERDSAAPQGSPLLSTPSPSNNSQRESYFDAVAQQTGLHQNRAAQHAGERGLKIRVPQNLPNGRSSPGSTSPIGLPRSPRPIVAGGR